MTSNAASADTIFCDGDIITMNDSMPSAEAIAIKDGKIVAVSSKADVLKTKFDATRIVNLNGKTLLSGFIDCWSHIGPAALTAVHLSGIVGVTNSAGLKKQRGHSAFLER